MHDSITLTGMILKGSYVSCCCRRKCWRQNVEKDDRKSETCYTGTLEKVNLLFFKTGQFIFSDDIHGKSRESCPKRICWLAEGLKSDARC